MQDNENINIIVVTHNDSKTIKRTLESVTKGIRPPNQVIVTDNDSVDGTYDILCKLLGAEKITIGEKTGWPPQFDSNYNGIPVKIFRKKLSTTGHSVNVAMQMSYKGVTIFGFVGKGTWYSGDKISQAVHVFNNHPSVACVVSDCDDHHSDGRVERVFRDSFDVQRLLVSYPYDRNFLVRTQVFPRLKCGFNEQMSIRDDYEFLLRVSEIGLIYHIPAPLHNNTVEITNETTKQLIAQSEATARQLASQRRNKQNG